jgi:long-chain acyl-CoA synthetase
VEEKEDLEIKAMANLWDVQSMPAGSAEIVVPGDTIPAIFWNAVALRRDDVWLREKQLGIWRSWSWAQTADAVREIAAGLQAIGFAPGECASILSNTVIEWVLADLGVLSTGGVANGIYPTDAASQVHYLCDDSASTILFVEDDEQLDKALEVRAQLPRLRMTIVFDMEGLAGLNDPQVMSLDALRSLGRQHRASNPHVMSERIAAIDPASLAILVYTSGTTGKPKGAMHSHRSLVAALHGYQQVTAQLGTDERMCFLPLCHIAERMGGEYFAMYSGARLNFVENPETVPENVREIAPTVCTAVPRVWEKFYSAVTIAIKESSRAQQLMYAWAIGVGYQVADCVLARREVSAALKTRFRLARALVLDNVRKMIGVHRARLCVTGAAPISPELVKWYLALGVTFLPPAVMMMSFMRSVMRKNPSGSCVPTSPVCSQPSASIVSAVFSGRFR